MSPPEKLSKSWSRASAPDSLTTMMESLTTQKRQLARNDEADVALQFEDSYIIVSARNMSESSPVFREWLGSTASDPDTRSPTNPDEQRRKDEPAVLSLLGGLAVVAKTFRVVNHLSDNISPNLLQPFAKRLSRSFQDQEQPSFDRDARLTKIAYLLEQEAMFSVFTRRMILDHWIPLSQLDPSTARAFGPLLLLKLEEKRAEAINIIDFKIRQTATRTCRYCPITTYIPSIIAAIGDNLSPKLTLWPPRYDKYSVRQVLVAIHSLGKFRTTEGSNFQFCPYHRNLPVEVKIDFGKVSLEMSRLMLGAYYPCKADGEPHHSDCEHLESIRDLVESLDPLR